MIFKINDMNKLQSYSRKKINHRDRLYYETKESSLKIIYLYVNQIYSIT